MGDEKFVVLEVIAFDVFFYYRLFIGASFRFIGYFLGLPVARKISLAEKGKSSE